MIIAVIDGQGGGLGKAIIEKIKKDLTGEVKVIALGTNSVATSVMLKAGAHEGASGENAFIHNVGNVDIITGSFNMIIANSMLGEITPRMVSAVIKSPAKKVLLPFKNSEVYLVGIKEQPLPRFIEEVSSKIKEFAKTTFASEKV
ncbi:MAG: hypothetical protein CVU88_02775 [Firmicutes bacterium HGW-Firmicutes-13]|nr:MAG: hypothetical protein CVU88_02775 [Firmicutes bacterium HGW-Firmicutes-13]